MSETTGLVTWNSVENLGKIPGSDWVCPLDDVARMSFYEKRGGEITDEAIQAMAGGRPQYLELLRYPEGYHTLQIVHAATGEVMTDEISSRRYTGYVNYRHDSRIDGHTKPGVRSVIEPDNSLTLDQGRHITSFAIFGGTTRTTIYSKPVATHSTDIMSDSCVGVKSQDQVFDMILRCRAGSFDGSVNVFMRESNGKTEAILMMQANNPTVRFEQVNLRVDTYGDVKGVDSDFNKRFLCQLGVDTTKMTWTKGSGKGTVTDPEQQKIAADSIAKILGMPRWEGIDLRMTASGLYAALGSCCPELNEIIVPRVATNPRPL